jgi:hypothetical protein
MNQFYRLKLVGGSYVKTTRWNCVVRDENFDSKNCMATAGAVAAWAETNGSRIITPCQIRQNGGDLVGGMGVDDVQTAWQALGIGTFWTPDWFNWTDVMGAVREENRLAVVGGDHDQIPYGTQCQKGGTFDHAFWIHDVRSDGSIVWGDPLCTGYHITAQSYLREAVQKLARVKRLTEERLYVGLTRRRPEAVTLKYKLRITNDLAFWSYGLRNGELFGRKSERLPGTGTDDVPCSAKHRYPYLGVSKDVYLVTKGVYEGKWISAPQNAVKVITV